MPSKSRHGHRKYQITSKKRREKQRPSASTTRQPINTPTSTLVSPMSKVDSKVGISAPSETPDTSKYDYVFAELKGIGILTGIILVILIVLALVLRSP